MNLAAVPAIVRYELDASRPGREYGELRVFVRFPGYDEHSSADNKRIWALLDDLQDAHPEWNVKDGNLRGHVHGCGPDEILATKRLR
jgi:hypothetical protein